ncbi:alpha-L-fucosidase [Coccinella septempunctata]|uniref:alpha-L-fucosidase n=1 Tax=Coccinella septempunctata TaxID=41139 RepID=UPI001D08AE46|nr:alpha-L-fucosidase [Coccinella septempunctata]
MKLSTSFVFCLACCVLQSVGSKPTIVNFFDVRYEPDWDSLDSRPLPKWYDEAKIGIFLHWGVFSVPSFGSEWFWADWKSNASQYVEYMQNNYPKGFTYQDFARDFKAEFFNPKQWAEIFKKSGAKYVVLTSKHHEGYTLWPSEYSFSWNAKDIGPNRDLVGDISKAVRDAGLTFGLYHSLYEWFNPMYLSDKASNFTSTEFVDKKIVPEMKEIVEKYEPDVLWSDGDWEAKDSYWKSEEFVAWLYNESPVKDTIVVNDRWGIDIPCKHGDFYTCTDRYNPGTLQKHKWENAMTLDKKSWGFRRNAPLEDYLTIRELLKILAETISCGGNLLINVGPTKDGIIVPIFEERLKDLGNWLKTNGEAIYGSRPWLHQNDSFTSDVWYTQKSGAIYAIVLNWPERNVLKLSDVQDLFNRSSVVEVVMLGNNDSLKWSVSSESVDIGLPDKATVKSEHAWVLRINSRTYFEFF